MADVVDLARWRKDRGERGIAPPAPNDEAEERLSTAVQRLDALVHVSPREAPAWVQTEVLAITGCVSQGWIEDAAARAEALVARCEKVWKPA